MFSKACEYGIKAAIYIAKQSPNKRVNLNDIAQAIDSPTSFTAKILQKLVHHRIIESQTGPHGGFLISPEKFETIKLSQIVKAIDGDSLFVGCALGLPQCNELEPCPMHEPFKEVRNAFTQMLDETRIRELSDNVGLGKSFLKIEQNQINHISCK